MWVDDERERERERESLALAGGRVETRNNRIPFLFIPLTAAAAASKE